MWHIIIFQVLQMISKWNIKSFFNLTNTRRHFEIRGKKIWEKKIRKKFMKKMRLKKMRFEKIKFRKKTNRKKTKKKYQNNWKKKMGKWS